MSTIGAGSGCDGISSRRARGPGLRLFRRSGSIQRTHAWRSAVSYSLVGVAALAAVLPFFFVVSASVKDSALPYHYPPVWIPAHLYWGNFAYILGETNFLRWVFNTLVVAGAVTAIKVVIDSMAAYAFARLHIPFKGALFVAVIASMMIPIGALLLPLYFLVRAMGLLNTYWALILPPLANPLGIFLMRAFIDGLPQELENAARLDGASEVGVYVRIVLPQVKPGLAVLAILTFTAQYTSLVWPLASTNNDSMRMIAGGLSGMGNGFMGNAGVFSAGAVMAMVPITLFFVIVSRYVTLGSLARALPR